MFISETGEFLIDRLSNPVDPSQWPMLRQSVPGRKTHYFGLLFSLGSVERLLRNGQRSYLDKGCFPFNGRVFDRLPAIDVYVCYLNPASQELFRFEGISF